MSKRITLILIVLFIFLENTSLFAFFQADWGLKIVVFNFGQSDGAIILTPDGDVAIVDMGRVIAHGTEMAGFLKDEQRNGVKEITDLKYLFVSHYDQDHIGGAKGLGDNGIEISEVFDQGPSKKRKVSSRSYYGRYVRFVGDNDGDGKKDSNEKKFVRIKARPGLFRKLGKNDQVDLRILSVDLAPKS
jgi:glyoxylase-like metal-dependent hydrolase (beta-lactamase superfamily II)